MDAWFFVAIVLLGVAELARHATPRWRRSAADAYARRVDLRLEPDAADVVASRLARRRCVGAVTGVVVGVGLAALLGGLALGSAWAAPWLAFLGFFLGHAVGTAAVTWWESSRPLPPGPRVARASAPQHDDYVPRIERWGGRATAVAAALVAAGLGVVDGTGLVELGDLPGVLLVVTAVVPALVVVAVELAARRLLERRQAASTALELAWDDALRSLTLRDGATVAIATGLYASFGLLGVVGDQQTGGWPANPGVGVVSGAFVLLLGAAVVTALVALALNPERHFRRRLWSGAPSAPVAPVAPAGGAR